MTIVAVTGLLREARIVEGPGVFAIACGGNADVLRARLTAAGRNAKGIISIGIGGGLAPQLNSGACVIATGIVDNKDRFTTHEAWRDALLAKLPDASAGTIAGTDTILATPERKAELHERTGALAADMESHIAARFAAARELPFAALRIIADPAASGLPPAAFSALVSTGEINYFTVVRSVLRAPMQIPALLRTAKESHVAFAELLRCVHALGGSFAAPDFGKLLLDMG